MPAVCPLARNTTGIRSHSGRFLQFYYLVCPEMCWRHQSNCLVAGLAVYGLIIIERERGGGERGRERGRGRERAGGRGGRERG